MTHVGDDKEPAVDGAAGAPTAAGREMSNSSRWRSQPDQVCNRRNTLLICTPTM